MRITEQQFLDGLNADQAEYFNSRLIEIREYFQKSYAESVASVSAAKDQLLTDSNTLFKEERKQHMSAKSLTSTLNSRVEELERTVAELTEERDFHKRQSEVIPGLQEHIETQNREIARLTELIPAPVENYMITPGAFVERLERASPGVIDRLWNSETKEAARLAVTLFTWTDRIDCRPGGRLEGYLNLIVKMGLMEPESIAKVWI